MKRLFCLALCLLSCTMRRPHTDSEITAALQHYDRLIQKMDADSIALLYTPDGELGNAAKGRDSIRKFLTSFNNVKVLSVASQSDSIRLSGDSAVQSGTYKQEALVSGKDTLHLKGAFRATWLYTPEGWRIKRMNTAPDK